MTQYLKKYASAVLTSAQATSDSHHAALDQLGVTLSQYWGLKRSMAEGSEPSHITQLMAVLRPLTVGLSLCGAGAGGYLVAMLTRTASYDDICSAVHEYEHTQCSAPHSAITASELSVHRVKVDTEGITTVEKPNDAHTDISTYFF